VLHAMHGEGDELPKNLLVFAVLGLVAWLTRVAGPATFAKEALP